MHKYIDGGHKWRPYPLIITLIWTSPFQPLFLSLSLSLSFSFSHPLMSIQFPFSVTHTLCPLCFSSRLVAHVPAVLVQYELWPQEGTLTYQNNQNGGREKIIRTVCVCAGLKECVVFRSYTVPFCDPFFFLRFYCPAPFIFSLPLADGGSSFLFDLCGDCFMWFFFLVCVIGCTNHAYVMHTVCLSQKTV